VAPVVSAHPSGRQLLLKMLLGAANTRSEADEPGTAIPNFASFHEQALRRLRRPSGGIHTPPDRHRYADDGDSWAQ
jgi:hypothetical protein